MITTIDIVCCSCGKTITKKLAEIKRQQKRGKTKFYCNRSCAGKDNSAHLDQYKDHFKVVKYIRQPDSDSRFRWYIKCIKKNSKYRKQEYDIDIDYLHQLWEDQAGICPFTKQKLQLRTHSYNNKIVDKPYQASLDRIDNNKGYVKGNVRFVALIFNYAKNSFSDEQVIEFCQKVTSNG